MAGCTQAVYYRDRSGKEPVNAYLEALVATNPRAVAKIDDYVEVYLSGKDTSAPPPEHPISSQVDGELRELRVRFAKTRYRILYRRSGPLVVLLHILEKDTVKLPIRGSRAGGQALRGLQVAHGREAAPPSPRCRTRRSSAGSRLMTYQI